MNFNELVVVERSRLYDMEKELDQCKSTKPLQMVDEPILSEPIQQPEHQPIAEEQEVEPENKFLSDLIQELPVKSRESAKQSLISS